MKEQQEILDGNLNDCFVHDKRGWIGRLTTCLPLFVHLCVYVRVCECVYVRVRVRVCVYVVDKSGGSLECVYLYVSYVCMHVSVL